MIIRKLNIENLRNLGSVEIRPHESLNYFWGDNGAGKTSVLESVAVLSRGRSFRTTQAAELAGPDGPVFRVFAEVEDESGITHRAGLERSGSHWRGRLDGEDIRHLSRLTRSLPVVHLVPDSHQLVSGPPENRRRYLDWGLFHVKHGFLELWREFSKALKQRNAALRMGDRGVLDSVDAVLSEKAVVLDEMRKQYVERVSQRIAVVLEDLKTRVRTVEIRYQQGWKAESYLDSLVQRREKDIERGMTGTGPHRAELGLWCNGVPARAVLSRGEQKAFAAALLLTQAELLRESGRKPVLLLDDLVSEFDREHFDAVLEKSLAGGTQTWITGTSKPGLDEPHKMFHVEQGTVRELV